MLFSICVRFASPGSSLAAAGSGLELHFAQHDPHAGDDDAVLQVERLRPLAGSRCRGRCCRARAGPERDVGGAASATRRKDDYERAKTAIHPMPPGTFHTRVAPDGTIRAKKSGAPLRGAPRERPGKTSAMIVVTVAIVVPERLERILDVVVDV